jgi:hypothetical protein
LANDQAVDVMTGHASTVTGRAAPTEPRQVDGRMVTAWARQELPGAGGVAERSSDDLESLGDIPLDDLMPPIPDYRTWSYERFRDEMRPWFAEQFPWAVELEKVLNTKYGIEADYLDVLVIGGDIWQFNYDPTLPYSQTLARPERSAVVRLAQHYSVDESDMLHGAGLVELPLIVAPSTEELSPEQSYAKALQKWHAHINAMDDENQTQDIKALVWFSFRAGQYLANTRTAAYLWAKTHPHEASRIMNKDRYISMSSMTKLEFGEEELINQLRQQCTVAQECRQAVAEWLVVPGNHTCAQRTIAQRQKLNMLTQELGSEQHYATSPIGDRSQ